MERAATCDRHVTIVLAAFFEPSGLDRSQGDRHRVGSRSIVRPVVVASGMFFSTGFSFELVCTYPSRALAPFESPLESGLPSVPPPIRIFARVR